MAELPSPSALGSSLPRTPRTFAQIEKCCDDLKRMDDGQVSPMPAYHEEILYPDDAHRPRQLAFHDGLRTMLQDSMPRLQKERWGSSAARPRPSMGEVQGAQRGGACFLNEGKNDAPGLAEQGIN